MSSIVRGQETAQNPPTDVAGQIEQYRSTILSSDNPPATKKTVAAFLLKLNTPEAAGAFAALLGPEVDSEARLAICEAFLSLLTEESFAFTPPVLAEVQAPLVGLLADPEVRLRDAASKLLSHMLDPPVLKLLGDLSTQEGRPVQQRQAAVATLCVSVYRFEVVEQVVRFLNDPDPSVVESALDCLSRTLGVEVGQTAQAWRDWWAQQQAHGELQWLRTQVQRLAQKLAGERQRFQEQSHQDQARIAKLQEKAVQFQTQLFEAQTDAAVRDALVVGWLADEEPLVRETALVVLRRQVSENARPPSPVVREAMRGRLGDASVNVRRQIIQLMQATRDPADSPMLLARLPLEKDTETRRGLLLTLGQLGESGDEVIMALLKVVESDPSPECTLEAARSLAQLLQARTSPLGAEKHAMAAKVLFAAFSRSREGNRPDMTAAVLEDMVRLSACEFTEAFQTAIGDAQPAVLVQALRGAAQCGAVGVRGRIRELTFAADVAVRKQACEALGQLGQEDADLEALLPRLNPTVEEQALVRQTAATAFSAILAKRPIAQQVAWLARLDGGAPEYAALLERLAASAKTHESPNPGPEDDALLNLLDRVLERGQPSTCADMVSWLVGSRGHLAEAAVKRVDAYLSSEAALNQADRFIALLAELKKIDGNGLGDPWREVLARAEKRQAETPVKKETNGDKTLPASVPSDQPTPP